MKHRMKHRLLNMALILVVLVPLFSFALPAQTSAILQPGPPGQPSDGQQAIEQLQAELTEINQNCQTVNNQSSAWNSPCQRDQNYLRDLANCSSNMFDRGGTAKGGGVNYTLDPSAFSDCQTKLQDLATIAGNVYTLLTSAQACKNVKGSDYNTCNGYQDSLNGINCGDLFHSNTGAHGSKTYSYGSTQTDACEKYVAGVVAFAANQYCQQNSYTGSQLQACIVGYTAQIEGQDQSKACSSYSGQDQAACTDGSGGAGGASGPSVPGGGGGGSSGVSCDLGISLSVGGVLNALNPLNWLLCGIVKGMNLVVTSLDTQINSMLVLGTGGNTGSDNPNNIFADSGGNCGAQKNACANYQTAWASFEKIALGLLVVVGLIIVISQALGMEVLDAYTIRKMLPRLLVAIIAITLSWQLMRFCITVSNDLGYGVGKLLDAPFHDLGQNIKVGGANGVLATFALALGGVFFDLFGMLAFVGTAAIAVLVAFLVLTLRQIAVILLIIFSPIAILAYVLPNTQRVYKFWWESFSKLLLMFPMIVAFITAGHIFSAIASDQGGGFVHQTIAFIAYFAPYFAIPFTFRFSGGLMSGIGNAVNSRGDGARGMLKNFRSGRAKKNFADLGTGTRFEGKKWIPGSITAANKFGEAGRGISKGWKGRYGLGPRGRSARGVALMSAAEDLQKTPGMQKLAGYNDANRMMAEGNGNELEGRKALIRHLTKDGGDDGKSNISQAAAAVKADAAAAAVKANGGFTKPHAMAALYSMAQDGTAIRDPKDAARLAAIVGGGDRNATFTTAAAVTGLSGRAGRYDLAAASDPIGKLAFAYGDQIPHAGPRLSDAKPGDIDDLEYEAWESGAGSEGAYGVLNGSKSRGVRFPAQEALRILRQEDARPERKKKAAAFLMHTQQGVQNGWGKPNNIEAFQEIMGEPENALALERFLQQPTTIQEPKIVGANPDGTPRVDMRPKETTMREDVSKIVGERASMTQEERERAAQEERDRREQDQA